MAMILNGLGFSNRQLYLVPQFFANKPVEHLLGPGIRAEMLNDDCLGRTLDWLYAHDLTKLFAGLATRARQIFGIKAEQVHVDTTSWNKQTNKQYQQQATQFSTRPLGTIEHSMIVLELLFVRASHHAQDCGDRSLSGSQDGSNQKHFRPFPDSFAKDLFEVAQHLYNFFRQTQHLFSHLRALPIQQHTRMIASSPAGLS